MVWIGIGCDDDGGGKDLNVSCTSLLGESQLFNNKFIFNRRYRQFNFVDLINEPQFCSFRSLFQFFPHTYPILFFASLSLLITIHFHDPFLYR